MPATTTPSILPDATIRAEISTKIDDFVHAVLSHPLMQQQTPHKTLYHVWDFASRAKYILSELDNVEAGRPVQYRNQFNGVLDTCEFFDYPLEYDYLPT